MHGRCFCDIPYRTTSFLLAIASGQRRSSLHALSISPGHIRWERYGVRLIPVTSFIAKNQTASSGSIEIFIRPLTEFSSIREDKVWCPVRALKWYIKRTENLRKSSQLFVTAREPHKGVSRDTLSRWIVSAIKAAGVKALEEGTTPKAHQTRSISSSWALFTGVGVEDICKAAFWRSANSFTSFYLRDVAASEGVFSTAPLKAAASSIVS